MKPIILTEICIALQLQGWSRPKLIYRSALWPVLMLGATMHAAEGRAVLQVGMICRHASVHTFAAR